MLKGDWVVAVVVVAIALYLGALYFRYSPIASGVGSEPFGFVQVWDHFNNRVCVASLPLGGKPLCSMDEIHKATAGN
jgi:hypothetical protein